MGNNKTGKPAGRTGGPASRTGRPAGRIGRYFKYAIGEIVLVVIGILIALQINNWNNEQIAKKSEMILLNQLQADLKESQKELIEVQSFHLDRARASTKVLNAFWEPEKQNDAIVDFIEIPLSNRIYSPILGTAKSLINSGNIDLISSVELKNAIISYVEKIEYTLKDIERYEETYYRNGVYETKKMIPNTIRAKEFYINEQKRTQTARMRRRDSLGLVYIPNNIETVPFKSDLKPLFKDESMYRAYYNLYIAHRNTQGRYHEMLGLTNDLLEKINSAISID